MKAFLPITVIITLLTAGSQIMPNSSPQAVTQYIGFDRNDYPGDANLKMLRQTFSYSGYWLNIPPGAKTNSWT